MTWVFYHFPHTSILPLGQDIIGHIGIFEIGHFRNCNHPTVLTYSQAGKSDPSFPIQKKKVTPYFLRSKARLHPRLNTFGVKGAKRAEFIADALKYNNTIFTLDLRQTTIEIVAGNDHTGVKEVVTSEKKERPKNSSVSRKRKTETKDETVTKLKLTSCKACSINARGQTRCGSFKQDQIARLNLCDLYSKSKKVARLASETMEQDQEDSTQTARTGRLMCEERRKDRATSVERDRYRRRFRGRPTSRKEDRRLERMLDRGDLGRSKSKKVASLASESMEQEQEDSTQARPDKYGVDRRHSYSTANVV
ncbi:hypothetical protein R6Q59_036003 [Mikania micrantha]